VDHLRLTCPRTLEIWNFFNHFPLGHDPATFPDLLRTRCRDTPEATVTTAIAWNVWKKRNNLSFNTADDPIAVTIRACLRDVRLWAYRCTTPTSAIALYNWCISFDPP
jgi:hypothetical protein